MRFSSGRSARVVLILGLAVGCVAVLPVDFAVGEVGTLRDGTIVAWGGSGYVNALSPPAGVFSDIAAGDNFGVAITAGGTLTGGGTLTAWGDGSSGQTAVPGGIWASVAAGGNAGLALSSGGTFAGWGASGTNFTGLPVLHPLPWKGASVSYYNAAVLDRDGQIFIGGTAGLGHLPVPPDTYKAVACGDYQVAALRVDGTLAAWGTDTSGEVGDVPVGGTYTAVAALNRAFVAIHQDTTLVAWGHASMTGVPVEGGMVAVSAASSADWGLALRSDGILAAWGDNTYAQLDLPVGIFTAVAHNQTTGYALRGATSYPGDLRVFGTGTTANLNRSVVVAGSVTIESPMATINRATLSVGADLTLHTGIDVYGDGAVSVAGDLHVTRRTPWFGGSALFVPVTVAGVLGGDGDLYLGAPVRYQFGLSAAPAFAGSLDLSPGSTLAFTGTGLQSCNTFRNDNGSGQGGTLRLGPGQALIANAAFDPATNAGTILLNPSSSVSGTAEFSVQGQLLNRPNGVISARNALLSASAGLVNEGGIAFTTGTSDVLGKLTNESTGSVTVTNGATVVFNDDVVQNGTLVIRKLGTITSTAIFLGGFSGSNGFTGGGTAFIEGDLAPGNSPASVLYDGDMVLGPTSSTAIEIGGRVAGTTYDQIHVTGELVLGGTLDLRFINGFTRPGTPVTYDIITAGTLTGMFDDVIFPDASIGWRLYRTPISLSVGSFAVVPEPVHALAVLAAPVLLARRRR